MSSILDALKKLEEERKRQLRLIEKDSIESPSDPTSEDSNIVEVSTSPESSESLSEISTSTPKEKPKRNYLTFGQIISIILLVGVFLTIISLSFSYVIVRTQLSQVIPNSQITQAVNPSNKTNEETNPIPNPSNSSIIENQSSSQPEPKSSISLTQTPDSKSSQVKEELKQEGTITKTPSHPDESQSIVKNENIRQKVSQTPTNPPLSQDKINNTEKTLSPSQPTNSKSISEKSTVPAQEVNSQPSQFTTTNLAQITPKATQEETSQNIHSTDVNKSTKEDLINSSIQLEKEAEKNIFTAQNTSPSSTSQPISPTPKIETRELPPPPINLEQFQSGSQPPTPPKSEPPVDISKLPVLKTSDKIRLGLENMQLNVLREASPKNPHGLAIINLTKVYVGEMIPGTPVKLIDVKTHGIAIEVVGTGERYYVPR